MAGFRSFQQKASDSKRAARMGPTAMTDSAEMGAMMEGPKAAPAEKFSKPTRFFSKRTKARPFGGGR